MIKWARVSASCAASWFTVEFVSRKMTVFNAINARVMTGQRRAVMFSWRIGISIGSSSKQPLRPTQLLEIFCKCRKKPDKQGHYCSNHGINKPGTLSHFRR